MRRLFFCVISCTLMFICDGVAWAEITVPYTVDEKPQVIFGDSIYVDTYRGLENYTHNYVGGYLHVTFTYTHHPCCFAQSGAGFYVTDRDPRATTTQIVKDFYPVYTLGPNSANAMGWYLYDIQFDATGYAAIITKGGNVVANFHRDIFSQIDTDWVALANIYPIQNPINQSSMSFTPLPVHESIVPSPDPDPGPDPDPVPDPDPIPEPVATTTPVIIVPGIMASILVDQDEKIAWPALTDILISPSDDFMNILKLSDDGSPTNNISPKSILKNLATKDFFEGLSSSLNSAGYVDGQSFFDYPYDWRLDISQTASDFETNEVLSLKEKIDVVKTQTGTDKVSLIAHSMGGLLVKKYLKDYGGSSVEKFIDIATPHEGSPKAFKILSYGDSMNISFLSGLVGLNPEEVKSISQNMPGVYDLLPSQNYFDSSDSNYQYYILNGVDQNSRLIFDQTESYLKSQGRNATLVDRAHALHEEIDNLKPSDYGVETYNIVGCGTPTIGQFYVLDDSIEHPVYNIHMISGDGTVPLKSAEAITASSTFYVKDAKHATLPSTVGVKELVVQLLTSTTTESIDISNYSNLANNSTGCQIPNGNIVSFHSPIDLHIYDQFGNHVGPDVSGDLEENIPGVIYETIEDNKFAFLPEGGDYTVKGNATDSGSFSVRMQQVVDGEVATTTLFANIPLTLTTQAEFTIGSTTPIVVAIDANNDGAYESHYSVSTTTQGILNSTGIEVKEKGEELPPLAPHYTSGQSISESEKIVPTLDIEALTLIEPKIEEPPAPIPVETIQTEVFMEPKQLSVENKYEYQNTAVVYKSFTYKVLAFLKKLWEWIMSKL